KNSASGSGKNSKVAKSTKTKEKKASAPAKVTKKDIELEQKLEKILAKGKERGFVTYDEILKEFPSIEEDVMFLDTLYEKLATAAIDILEGGGLLDFKQDEETEKKRFTYSKGGDSTY